ncbi:hypothetical protein ACVWZV_002212 [Bradyrhizobium sp. GM5.1]
MELWFKTYFQGEPIRVPGVDFPYAMISKRETRVGPVTNAEDEHGISLSITVVADIRNDLSTDENAGAVNAGVATLYEIIEGRNADYTLKTNSVLSILRHNPLIDSTYGLRTDLGTVTKVDYGLTLQNRALEEWSVEARVDFVASFQQVR